MADHAVATVPLEAAQAAHCQGETRAGDQTATFYGCEHTELLLH